MNLLNHRAKAAIERNIRRDDVTECSLDHVGLEKHDRECRAIRRFLVPHGLARHPGRPTSGQIRLALVAGSELLEALCVELAKGEAHRLRQ